MFFRKQYARGGIGKERGAREGKILICFQVRKEKCRDGSL